MCFGRIVETIRRDLMTLKQAFTFDDVALVPQFNNVPSRTEPVLSTWLTRNRKIDIPLLAANMDTVIGEPLADILLEEGSLPIFTASPALKGKNSG